MKRLALAIVTAFALGGLVGASALLAPRPADESDAGRNAGAKPVLTEVRWAFVLDQWGTGKAFQCAAADCGSEVSVYLRAKIGFCNCTTGVADDEELERVADLDLLGAEYAARAPGQAITGGPMRARSRP